MHPEFEREWREARALEIAGNTPAAKDIYDRLIAEGPDRLYVRLRLSAIEHAADHYGAAREHARLAADTLLRTARWKDLASVTRMLLTFDERELVRQLIMESDWSSPAVQVEASVLSQHLWLVDHFEEALALIDQAMPRLAKSPNLHYSRGNALKYLGRMDEAAEEFERCVRLDPNSSHGHWSLAYHQRSDAPRSRIPRILSAQKTFAPNSPEQPYFHYALFREYDDAGDVNAAWKHLLLGAAVKRKALPYKRDVEHAGFEALERTVTRDFVRAGTGAADAGHTPIFIVGMPRTGTTLMERIVGNHPDVRAGGELNDFNTALSIVSDHFIRGSVDESMVETLRDVDFARVGDIYLQRTAQKARGARFLVDKHPINFIYAGYIAKALPHARILCLRRSPMDACFSNLKELFASEAYGYSYDLDELAGHYQDFARLSDHWARTMPEQFKVVEYEALVADPVTNSQAVLEFCGLPFAPEIVDITRNTAPVATASSSQVRQPINTRGVGAWRKYARHLEPLRANFEKSGFVA